MTMPSKVILFCPMLDFKNKPAMLMTISPHGYYEVRVDMAAGNHTIYLPIAATGVVFQEPNVIGQVPPDVERYG
jgi:hypothetical protein